MSSVRLYTPELLALAVELSTWPPLENAALHGEARSPTCGSTLAMDVSLDGNGAIGRLGMRVRACAIGQASAAIFARHAPGRDADRLTTDLRLLEAWVEGEGAEPEWPDLALIDAARAYPARHGAILLPWRAALAALSSTPDAG
ncbi:iron-sulfur cluster assembly scaffold protein [Altererythrobacter sp. Root672]|uniref:iron-sulfur cluster assembly scaffold protein n=1 Tax=Altererythrobacter sp. Root672 TaxID=1736584 RepID=UPI0006FB38A3|nr:iron-sulfur cluster assembly scaffold protein [Altererythrobacter sp. Root672]KRA83321.1 Fe-S cluster protein [Altererythrobacter sp. Root672]